LQVFVWILIVMYTLGHLIDLILVAEVLMDRKILYYLTIMSAWW